MLQIVTRQNFNHLSKVNNRCFFQEYYHRSNFAKCLRGISFFLKSFILSSRNLKNTYILQMFADTNKILNFFLEFFLGTLLYRKILKNTSSNKRINK